LVALAVAVGACGRIDFGTFARVEAVEPTYSQAAGWTDHVRVEQPGAPAYAQPGTPCDGTEPLFATSCTHAGVQRRAALVGVATCDGVTATDSLGALQWRCDDAGGAPVVFATGLRAGAGLADLVDATGWRPEQLVVTLADGSTISTPPEAWWSDAVVPLAADTTLDQPNTIYVLTQSLVSAGNYLAVDHVALVTLRGATLTYGGGPFDCDPNTGLPANANDRCLVFAGNRKFLWIEGDFDAASAASYGIVLASTSFSELHRLSTASAAQMDVLLLASSGNRIVDVTAAHARLYGLSLTSSSGNVVHGLRVFDDGIANSQGNTGVIITPGADNVLTQITAANDFGYGILGYDGSVRNTYSHLTFANIPTVGIDVQGAGSSTVVQVLAIADQIGVRLDSNGNVGAQIAAGNQASGVCMTSASTFAYNLWLGNDSAADCRVGSTCNVAMPCASLSGAPVYTPGFDGTALLRDEVIADDAVNPSDNAGQAPVTAISDWVHFESPLRGWGVSGLPFPDPSDSGPCTAGTCRIWDWRVRPASAATVRGADGTVDTATVVAGAPCPPAADGAFALTDASGNTFLVNALEILGDGIGDDDGLCESGEACVYSSYFGADQGWDSSYGAATCAFHDGAVSGVELHGPS
jgi:hypothetical protein